ncbi:MAG: hypothetical protein NT004_07665 [Bacteroidetes bacterium]|nr:hypothetical protein [Bacteroidota bacterium]
MFRSVDVGVNAPCDNEDGVSLSGFLKLYGSDPFYSWIGLDSSLMYAAHKAAGGMTSVRQTPKNGVVFEVRQGYKSKDSKRQNADIDNATVAWANIIYQYLQFFRLKLIRILF